MQEEKKNQSNGSEKNDKQRSQKRHGYFMTPTSKEHSKATVQAPNASSPNSEEQNKSERNQEKRPNKQHKKNNTSKHTQEQADTNKQIAQTPQEMNVKIQPAQKKKNNKHKKKKNNVSDSMQTAVDLQPKPSEKTEKPKSKIPFNESKPLSSHTSDDYEEYKFVPDISDDVPIAPKAQIQEDSNAPKTEVIGIRFKSSGKVYYFAPNGKTFKKGSNAIVDTARGQEFGEVAMSNTLVKTSDIVPPLRPVVRSATTADLEHHKANKQKENDAFRICNEKISEHKLEMKLIDAQYTFDNSKLLFYFTSSERVDFRELVKDLASVFRTRIELRQIGIRDEAKIMGGLGMCGRPLCCTLFLSDFDQVSIKMAKEQNLSLNSAKISGICGRLMCCLKYEHEAYEYEIKRTPPVDSLVRTENGDGIVTEISPLRGTVKVRLLASPDIPPKSYHRDNVTMLRKKQNKQ